MLKELRTRLMAKPDCHPNCASINRLALRLDGRTLAGRLEVDVAAPSAVALPGSASQWLPSEVSVDGEPAKALSRTGNAETLWMELPEGKHQIIFSGEIPARDSVQLPLPARPHRVEVAVDGGQWHVAGLHNDGRADESLEFTRVAPLSDVNGNASSGSPSPVPPASLPPFVRIERTVHIGLEWRVDTRIERLTPKGSAVVLTVPLLAGERVTTADVHETDGAVNVNIAPDASSFTWSSVLKPTSAVHFVAPRAVAWTEVWRVDISPLWSAEFHGPPFVEVAASTGNLPEWRPWPGEEATVELVRPEAAGGQSLTIDRSELRLTPGLRASEGQLKLWIRSSRGATHIVTLPEGARIETFLVNGTAQPPRQEGRGVALAIVPGEQTVELRWREPTSISAVFRTATIDLGLPSANALLTVALPSRWLLGVSGPSVGPAVLFWSLIVVLLLVAAALGRVKPVPLSSLQWSLLTIGLSQVPVTLGAMFVGWLLALGWRNARPELPARRFNARQVLLALWTIAALGVLCAAIYSGLLGTPEMQVVGNGSSASELRWFSDRAPAQLPTATVMSVPLMVYRGAMLAWAVWMAFAILRWLQFAWAAFSRGGLWRTPPSRSKTETRATQKAPPGAVEPGPGSAPTTHHDAIAGTASAAPDASAADNDRADASANPRAPDEPGAT